MARQALTHGQLERMIAGAVARFDDVYRRVWETIRIEPRKWACCPEGDAIDGFWAVATQGGRVLWFNEIEDGFNWSEYSRPGTIERYGCDQSELGSATDWLARIAASEGMAAVRSFDVPAALAGPGTIEPRHGESWIVRSYGGAEYLVRLEEAAEAAYVDADHDAVDVLERHPLLAEHDEPACALHLGSPVRDATAVARAIDRVILDATEGWRGLQYYVGGMEIAQRQLEAGERVLMQAPSALSLRSLPGSRPLGRGHRCARRGRRAQATGSCCSGRATCSYWGPKAARR